MKALLAAVDHREDACPPLEAVDRERFVGALVKFGDVPASQSQFDHCIEPSWRRIEALRVIVDERSRQALNDEVLGLVIAQ